MKERLNDFEKIEIREAMKNVRKGKTKPIEEVAEELKIKLNSSIIVPGRT